MPQRNAQSRRVVIDDPDDGGSLTAEEQAALEAADATDPDAPVVPPPQEPEPTPAPTEPPKEPAPTEEPPPEPESAAGKKEPSVAQKRIQALIEARDKERQEKAEIQRQLDETKQQWARLDERRKQMAELEEQARRQAQAAQQQAQRPDPDVDPMGAKLWDQDQRIAQLLNKVQGYEQFQERYTQQTEQQRFVSQVEGWRANQESAFAAQHPDYQNAVNHLHNVRVRHFQALGFPPDQAEGMWQSERFAHMVQAAQNAAQGRSVNFGEYVYGLARDTGYQPPALANGGQPQPTQQGQVMPNGKERLGQIAAAQKVQGLGGKVTAAESDQYHNIRTMPAQQFAAWLDQNFPDGEDLMELKNNNPTLYKVLEQRMNDLG